MTLRRRKLVGTFALLAFLALYVSAAMIAAVILQALAPAWAEPVYYVIAGLLWVPPAAVIVRWMSLRDA